MNTQAPTIDRDILIDDLIDLAFREDIGPGDYTTLSTIPADAMGSQRLLVKQTGVLSGVDVALKVLHKLDPSIKVDVMIKDGARVQPGDVAFVAHGPVRSLLTAERTLLNIMQRMSGVATMTAQYQDRLHGLKAKVLDTRKTTPGMRVLEKDAVLHGGGANHRMGLYDMILIKDNHVDFAGGIPQAVAACRKYLKENGLDGLKIELETRSLDEVAQALEQGVDRIMLDNFTPALTAEAVKMIDGRAETESSGGITIDTIRDYGEAGVDFISVGALTHSVPALDLSFKAV